MHKKLHHHVRHLFIPHESNNHRPQLLHHVSLLLFIAFFTVAGLLLPPLKQSHPDVLGISSDITVSDLVTLTNKDRAANGLAPLSLNNDLLTAAQNKATYMFKENFWAHIAPDGTTPWVFIKNAGYDYIYAGENLARGYTTSDSVEQAWMNSPEHRANILSPNYHDVGFAIAEGTLTGEDTVLVVAEFGSEADTPVVQQTVSSNTDNLTPTVAVAFAQAVSSPTPSPTSVPPLIARVQIKPTSPPAVAAESSKPLIDSATTSKNIGLFVLLAIMAALLLDLIFIQRKKVVRFVAHNVDHIIFLGMIVLIIVFLIARGAVV